jgi:hypothetical protein
MARPAAGSNLTIVQLEQMLNSRKSERQRLERDRTKLQRRLDQLDARIRALGGNGGGRGRGAAGGGGGGRVQNAKSLIEMIEGVLGKAGKPMNVGDIATAVQAGGYRTNSVNFRGIVNQTLIKDKRFIAASRGMYQMKK